MSGQRRIGHDQRAESDQQCGPREIGHQRVCHGGFGHDQQLHGLRVPPAGALGDYVWEDLNRNGLQEGGEPGVPNVPVRLYDCNNTLLASTTTGPTGFYLFTNLPPGGYVVGFGAPATYQYTPAYVGNDALDSDANPLTGFTTCYPLGSGETNLTVDAGLVRSVCPGDFVWNDQNRNGIQDV